MQARLQAIEAERAKLLDVIEELTATAYREPAYAEPHEEGAIDLLKRNGRLGGSE
jgi:hypothetical protein